MNIKVLIVMLSFIISTILFFTLSYMSFNSYQLSMGRVFNVEKSIGTEFYPYKISQALIDEKSLEDIKEIIDSNHWVFNTIITDCQTNEQICSEQNIILSQYEVDDLSKLENETWAPLRSPAPFDIEKKVSDYKLNKEIENVDNNNTGEIIGRIYFMQSESFTSRTLTKSLVYWVTNAPKKIFDGRINNDNYSFTKNLIVSFALFLTMCILGILVNLIQKIRSKERSKYEISIKRLRREYSEQKLEKDKLISNLNKLRSEKSTILLEQESIREASLELENKQKQLINSNSELESKYNFILNFAMANKFQLESEFTAPLRNQVQKLDLIIEGLSKRNHYDTKDALHDLRKAKLFKLTDKDLENCNLGEDLQKKLIQSRNTIKWTAENIESLTNLNMQKCNIDKTLTSFLDNRPPSANLKHIDINYKNESTIPLIIEANPYHIKAIIKNTLYNALTELEEIRLMRFRKNPEDFDGKVDITSGEYKENNDYVFFKVTDNAGGVPEDFINNLYESHKKVNVDASSSEGNGSLIVASYLSMYEAKVIKRNVNDGFEVTFLFKKINEDSKNG